MRLEAIETTIPEHRIEVADTIRDAGGSADEIRLFQQLFGMQTLASADPGRGLHGYLAELLDRIGPPPQGLGPVGLFHAHSLPVRSGQRLADLGRLASHPALSGLSGIWDVDQFNCAGMFYALAAAERLLDTGIIGSALIFGGDCLSDWPLAQRYVPSCTALGDGYALLRLSNRTGGLRIGPVSTRYFAGYAGGLDGPAGEIDRYNRAHVDIVHETLAMVGHDPYRGTLFPHNINGLSWRLFSRMSGLARDRIHDGLVQDIGHCCNADPFIVLDRALSENAVDGTLLSVGMAGFTGAAPIRGARQTAPAPLTA